jgi:hypothetical protein
MTSNEFEAAAASISLGVWQAMMTKANKGGDYEPMLVAGVRINCGMNRNAVRLALHTKLRQTPFDEIRAMKDHFKLWRITL